MNVELLDTPEDVKWLFETFLKGVTQPNWVRSFLLYGNEDAPAVVALYDRKAPLVSDAPRYSVRWEQNEETGNEMRVFE